MTRLLILLSCCLLPIGICRLQAQAQTSCNPPSSQAAASGEVFFTFGSVSNAKNNSRRSGFTVGQAFTGQATADLGSTDGGFWARYILPPKEVGLIASQGDFPNRVTLSWQVDPLGSPPTEGFVITRDGQFLSQVGVAARNFIDFNVQAGEFYEYGVSGINALGEGRPGKAVGFVNPNGAISGRVASPAGNPITGTVVRLQPTIGKSLYFDGINDYVCISHQPDFLSQQFSFISWVKLDEANGAAIIDLGSDLNKNWWLRSSPAGQGKGIVAGIGEGSSYRELTHLFSSNPDGWHQVAMTYGNDNLTLYVDGQYVGNMAASMQSVAALLTLGSQRDKSSFFKGRIDDVRIFDRLLPQSEIICYKDISISGSTPGLSAYWKFDEGMGVRVFDLSPNDLHADIYGAVFSSDTPGIQNAAITDNGGIYNIEGINYSSTQTFTAIPSQNFYNNYALEFSAPLGTFARLADMPLPDTSTIEIVVHPFDTSTRQTLLSKTVGTGNVFELYLENGQYHLTFNSHTQAIGAAAPTYQRLALTIQASSNSLHFYNNGASAGSYNFPNLSAAQWSDAPWMVGANNHNQPTHFFTGLVDEVAVFDTVLSQNTLQLHASVLTSGGIDPAGANSGARLRAYYAFNEGKDTLLFDSGPGMLPAGTFSQGSWSTVTARQDTIPHLYLPSTRTVNINSSNTAVGSIDFTDISTITISGVVRYENTFCYAEGVEILVNGSSNIPPIMTDSTGRFSAEFQPGQSVRLSAKYKNHSFFPGFFEVRNLTAPLAGVLFQDLTKRQVAGQVAGGDCRQSVIPPTGVVKVYLAAVDGCWDKTLRLTETDGRYLFMDVPPLALSIAVSEHSDPDIFAYFNNLGGQQIDLDTVARDTVNFIYKSTPRAEISPLGSNSCAGQPALLRQGVDYIQTIRVYEPYYSGVCYLDTARLLINNNIADKPQTEVQMDSGRYNLIYRTGLPTLTAPYTKTLQVSPLVGNAQGTAEVFTAAVLGKRPRLSTFQSKSPQIPFLILRDPPGDGSYAYVEEGQTTCGTFTLGISAGLEQEQSLEIELGPDATTSIGIGAETELEIQTTATTGITTTLSYQAGLTRQAEYCITNTTRYQTSEQDDRVGGEQGGDLYIGAAINFIYGKTDNLGYNPDSCMFTFSESITVFPDTFETEFIYTEHQIENVVIPELTALGELTSAQQWRDIINKNKEQKQTAVYQRNISFDGGPVYEFAQESSAANTTTFSFQLDYSSAVASVIGASVNDVGVTNGITTTVSFGVSTEAALNNTNTRTVGFVLNDDDANDNFSVDILEDRHYATPVFRIRGGQSMCPWEPGTQNREELQLTIDRNVAENVPSNDPAVFNVTLANVSQSAQTMNYIMTESPGFNPLGAEINIVDAGRIIPIQLQAFENRTFTTIINRGPIAYTYENLRIAAYSQCEYDRALALGNNPRDYDTTRFSSNPFFKEVEFDVFFIEPCSEIDIAPPVNNVIIPSSGDTFMITLNRYDPQDTDLEQVRVQYRNRDGNGSWINFPGFADGIPRDSLGELFEIVPWVTTGLQDGFYEIRAVTICSSTSQESGISSIIPIRIERQPPVVLGIPEPADGVLSPGDEISIRFTKRINCGRIFEADQSAGGPINNNNLGLYDATNGALIDAIITCNEDKVVIVPNIQNRFIENRTLRVRIEDIEDLVGNQLAQPAIWEFFVNRSSLYWTEANIDAVVVEGNTLVISRDIKNQGGSAMSFTLTGIPAWADVFPTAGTLQPGAAQTITFTFPASLVGGSYQETLRLMTAEGEEPLPISLRVTCPPPFWDVNPADYLHSMNMTVELNVEGQLSTDRLDMVGAFVGGECRGLAHIQYNAALGKYLAFLTVFSNTISGETVRFQVWDASACLLYGSTLETFTFTADGLIGSPLQPQVLHTQNLLRLSVPLIPGWNWISYNVNLPDPSLNTALASLSAPQNATIKGQASFSQYFNSGGFWTGSLNSLSHLTMYQYRSAAIDSLILLGTPVNPATTPLPLSAGWNWIGFLPRQGMSTDSALQSLQSTALNGDIIKGQATFAQYVAGIGWVGNLTFMRPGKGYLLYLSNPGILQYPPRLHNPEEEVLFRSAPVQDNSSLGTHWQVDPLQFEHTMNLIAVVRDGDLPNCLSEGDEVGAFVNGQLRGANKPVYIPQLDTWLLFLTVYANEEGENLQFVFFDTTTAQEIPVSEQIVFIANRIVGSIELPRILTLATPSAVGELADDYRLTVYPNPAGERVFIQLRLPEAQPLLVSVADPLGRQVYTFAQDAHAGQNLLEWKPAAALPAGWYTITLQTSAGVITRRVQLVKP